MSFMRTLATMAVGFAAAKGLEQYQKMGGLDGMMKAVSAPGGLADNLGGMAEKMGIPGGASMVHNAMAQMSSLTTASSGAAQAGMAGLFATLGGTAAAGSGTMADMMHALTGGGAVSDMAEENAKLMIRAMIQAAKADGEIDPDEQARIMEHLKDAPADEIAFVKAEMARPLDVAALVADTQATMKSQVYSSALMAITVDSPAETAFLQQLAAALGIDAATRDALHAAQGRAPLGA
ncbi:MAG: DUF533 domain-containing protein [Rhodobacteraceae bacterium]|nr:DUF533 domain-containing protein [Paracoccaceae bacterium]